MCERKHFFLYFFAFIFNNLRGITKVFAKIDLEIA